MPDASKACSQRDYRYVRSIPATIPRLRLTRRLREHPVLVLCPFCVRGVYKIGTLGSAVYANK
ncbi:MAG: hypothetical protein ACXV5H_10080 [Halobacteriota archaeon]